MDDEDKKILEDSGWIIECESPFEISLSSDPQSRATGYAAEVVLQWLKDITD